MERLLTSLGSRLLLAIGIGVGVVLIVNGTVCLVTQKSLSLSEEGGVFAFQAVLMSIPFLILAVAGIDKKAPWLVGFAMTLAVWGFYLADSLIRYGDGSGANIGLGLLLIVSPLVIAVASLAVAKNQKREP